MAKFGNIIEALVVGKTTLNNLLLRKFLGNLVAVVVFTTIASIMLGILLTGGLYLLYQCLLANGFTPHNAYLITGGIVVFLLVICFVLIVVFLKRLRRSLQFHIPSASKAQDVIKAFVDGFNNSSNK